MASELLLKSGTAIEWSDGGSDYDITLDSLASTEARQGAKGDLGDGGTTWAPEYNVQFLVDTGTAPTVGGTVDLYWAASGSATTAAQNPGGTSGSDAAYTGIGTAEISESVPQLQYIGSLVVVDVGTTEMITNFVMSAPTRWGMPVVVNNTNQTLGTGQYVKLIPIIPEGQ